MNDLPAQSYIVGFCEEPDEWFLCMVGKRTGLVQSSRCVVASKIERQKGIRWMPWHQEAMKDVARCAKPWGAASRL